MEYGTRTSISPIRDFVLLIISVFYFSRILSVRFPTNNLQWSINPEFHIAGGFPDLLVTANDFTVAPPHRPWTVMYEGKSSTGDNYEHIRNQLNEYGNSALGRAQFCYMIGARGR